MFNTAATSFDRPSAVTATLHHSHSDSNCYRLYQQKRLQKRHSATSAIVSARSFQQDSLRPSAQPCPNPSSIPACSLNPVTHHIFHDYHEPQRKSQSEPVQALGGPRMPKTRGLFQRVTRKLIEWIRGSIVPGTNKTSNDDPNHVQLDDEMEKVFGSVGTDKERFELKRLNDEVLVDNSPLKYDESHRSVDNRPLLSSAALRPMDSPAAGGGGAGGGGGGGPSSGQQNSPPTSTPTSPISISSKSETTTRPSHDTTLADNTSNDFSEAVQDEPVVDQGTLQGEQWDASARRNVHFDSKDRPPQFEGLQIEDSNEERRRRTERHHPHKSRKFSLQEYHPEWRRQSGAEGASTTTRRVSVQPEDATLQEADIDELTSHRSDDPRALRRHKVSAQSQTQPGGPSMVNINRKDGDKLQHLLPSNKFKKMYDHSPHEVFVQLDELTGSGEDREWKETARWIKYEEDVEEGADRWGRPHVASLSFHSLLNLRRCLETGVVLMDLEEKDLPSVAYRIVEQMVIDELIHEDDKPTIMRALLLRHRHVNEHSHGGFHFGPKRKYSSYSSLQSLSLRAEDGNGEVIVGVRRLNSFVSPTQSYTLSPPSLHHPNYSPSLASKQHQNNGHQRHTVQRQPSSGSTSGGSVHHHPFNSSQHHQQHQRHKRSESQDSSCALPVAITTVTSAVGMRRNSPISLTVVNEVMTVPH